MRILLQLGLANVEADIVKDEELVEQSAFWQIDEVPA